MHLPATYTTRPLNLDDAQSVFEVMAAVEQEALGHVDIELADIVADWQRPSFDVTTSTLGVFQDEHLIAYGEYQGAERSDAAVHPDHTGRGLGTYVAHWIQQKARERGASIVGMPVPQGSLGDALLTALGYHVRWTSWVLQLPGGTTVPPRPLPDGYQVRQAEPQELPELHDVAEDAFLEWSDRDRESLADFEAETVLRPGFEPWMLRVVIDTAGRIAAVATLVIDAAGEAYVSRLATRVDQRHRGLAQALLIDAFAVGREHGATTFGLSTDSRTGALDLYRKVGMEVTDVWLHRAITL